MVSGHTQDIDSAPVKANASMDSLELKGPKEDQEAHLHSHKKRWVYRTFKKEGLTNWL